MPRKKTKVDNYDDSWMYILLLTTLTVLTYSLSTYTFKLTDIRLTYSIFLLPVLYLISNYITKKYGYGKTILAIAVSSISIVAFTLIMNFALVKPTTLDTFSGHFCALVVSHFVNLMIYQFLINNTNAHAVLILLTYLFALVTFYLFYTLIHLNMIVVDNYWKGYFITIGIQSLVCLVLTIIDKKIKVGR